MRFLSVQPKDVEMVIQSKREVDIGNTCPAPRSGFIYIRKIFAAKRFADYFHRASLTSSVTLTMDVP
jgi:hypothetical protein